MRVRADFNGRYTFEEECLVSIPSGSVFTLKYDETVFWIKTDDKDTETNEVFCVCLTNGVTTWFNKMIVVRVMEDPVL